MSALKRNVVANYLGKFWGVFLSVLLVPVYVSVLGLDAYGLIGFFTVIMATASLLDVGLGATMNREMARFRTIPNRREDALDLAHTLLVIYWCIGFVMGIAIFVAAPWISSKWLNATVLPAQEIVTSVRMMGVCLALQWPISLYSGGINGLERQVAGNLVLIAIGTIRNIGAAIVLVAIAPSITAYFAWQTIVSAVSVSAFAILFWRVIPSGARKPKFELSLISDVWRFAIGMGASGVVTFLLSQLDKLILSKMLSLSLFGHYNIANQINVVTKMSPASIYAAFLPQLTSLYARNDRVAFARLHSAGCQLVAIVSLPASFAIAAFSFDIIRVWTGSLQVAEMSASIATVLIIGSAFNSLMGMPYTATIAAGWATFGLFQNAISAILVVPLMLSLASLYGGLGAAVSWLVLNVGYMIVSPLFIHRRVLSSRLMDWYLIDVGRPLITSASIVIAAKLVLPTNMNFLSLVASLFATWLVAVMACTCCLPEMRVRAIGLVRPRSFR